MAHNAFSCNNPVYFRAIVLVNKREESVFRALLTSLQLILSGSFEIKAMLGLNASVNDGPAFDIQYYTTSSLRRSRQPRS